MHLSDLHIGKKVHGFDFYEEQQDILAQIVRLAKKEQVDGIIIAGDVYDQAVPPVEGVRILDGFLSSLAVLEIPVYMISGNHDSAGRLEFASRLLENSGIHIYSQYEGVDRCIMLDNGHYGKVYLHLLPYIKPRQIRQYEPAVENDYGKAFQYALCQMDLNKPGKHILAAHQFFSGSSRTESEEQVGGLDVIDAGLLEGFDYCALGHLHKPQSVGADHIRYCGSPLRYSASETDHYKSATILEITDKAEIRTVELIPIRQIVRLEGLYEELTSRDFIRQQNLENYFDIHLLDEAEIVNGFNRLQEHYPKIMRVAYDRLEHPLVQEHMDESMPLPEENPIQLMARFFLGRTGHDISAAQEELLKEIWQEVEDAAD